jgi:hypothetical protein
VKIANLLELNEKRNLDLVQVTTDNKCLSDLLKSQKTLFKKELDAKKCHMTAQVQLKKGVIKELHKVDCKRQTKDDDFARDKDKMKKDMKARDVQLNLGFAANMLQNTTNMNGGMLQTGSVADVSC